MWMLALFLMLSSCGQAFSVYPSSSLEGEISPQNPIVQEGDALELVCNVTQSEKAIDSQNLYFQFGNERIPSKFMEYGDSWVKLSWPDIPYNKTFGHMYCYCDGCKMPDDTQEGGDVQTRLPDLIDQIAIVVYRQPIEPNITGCVVYNWKRLVCEWTPTVEEQRKHTGLVTNQTLYWSVLKNGNDRWHKCDNDAAAVSDTAKKVRERSINMEDSSIATTHHTTRGLTGRKTERCAFPIDSPVTMQSQISLIVQLYEPRLGDFYHSFNITEFHPTHIVKPDPIRHLRSRVSATEIRLWWEPPNEVTYRSLQYRVNVTSQWQPHDTKSTRLKNVTELNLTDLTPNTEYTVTVECIPILVYSRDPAKNVSGFYSDVTIRIDTTNSTVPGAAPEVTNGSFIMSKTATHHRNMQIYLKAIPGPQRQGDINGVRVCQQVITAPPPPSASSPNIAPALGECETTTKPPVCHLCHGDDRDHCHVLTNLTLLNNQYYRMTVQAKTKHGYNSSLSLQPITILPQEQIAEMHEVLESLVVIGDNTVYGVHINWTHVAGAVQYTVYYCRGRDQCRKLTREKDSEIEWMVIKAETGEDGKMRPLPTYAYVQLEEAYETYVFGVSAEKRAPRLCGDDDTKQAALASSGIYFYSHCIPDFHRKVGLPRNFDFAADSEQQSESLMVKWKNPNCIESGYIQHYVIKVCRSAKCDKGVYEASMIVPVDHVTDQMFIIPNLLAEESYKVAIQSWSPHDHSNFTVTHKTKMVTRSGLNNAQISGVVFGSIVILIVVTIGAVTIYRCCHRRLAKFAEGPDIVLPVDEAEGLTQLVLNGSAGGGAYARYTTTDSAALLEVQNAENYSRWQEIKQSNGTKNHQNGNGKFANGTAGGRQVEMLPPIPDSPKSSAIELEDGPSSPTESLLNGTTRRESTALESAPIEDYSLLGKAPTGTYVQHGVMNPASSSSVSSTAPLLNNRPNATNNNNAVYVGNNSVDSKGDSTSKPPDDITIPQRRPTATVGPESVVEMIEEETEEEENKRLLEGMKEEEEEEMEDLGGGGDSFKQKGDEMNEKEGKVEESSHGEEYRVNSAGYVATPSPPALDAPPATSFPTFSWTIAELR